MFETMVSLLGYKGMLGAIGLCIFLFVHHYAGSIFQWIENQTYGTRTYIMEKLELCFIEVDEDKLTYALLFLSVGSGLTCVLLLGYLGFWITGVFLGGILMILGFRIPKPVVDFMVERRIKQYQGQLVDGLTLLANGLRAGLSVPQALGMVVDEMPAPISQEFNLILQQNRIGVTLEECFENLVKRVPIEDNEMFVSSVNILRETGGNLAEVFDTIVGVIRERIRLQQKIDTYTAQGMFQGITIACMPFAIGAIYSASDPKSMVPMFTHPLGIVLTIAALGLDFIGFMIIKKIVKIKI